MSNGIYIRNRLRDRLSLSLLQSLWFNTFLNTGVSWVVDCFMSSLYSFRAVLTTIAYNNPIWVRICPIIQKVISTLLEIEIHSELSTMSSKCFWYFWAWLCTCCLLRVPIWIILPQNKYPTCLVTRFQSFWYSLMASKKRACSSSLHSPSCYRMN